MKLLKPSNIVIFLVILIILGLFIHNSQSIIYHSSISDSGIVAHYKLDGNAKDSVGSHDGSINGATPTSDAKFGQACSFDGVDDNIKADIPSITGKITISVWFKQSSDARVSLVSSRYTDLDIRLWEGLQRVVIYEDDGSGSFITGDFDFSRNLGEWYHLVYVQDGNVGKLYKNGKLQGVVNSMKGTTWFDDYDLGIGSLSTDANFFNGTIDDVKIFNRALSDGEVQALYQSGSDYYPTTSTCSDGIQNGDEVYIDCNADSSGECGISCYDKYGQNGELDAPLEAGRDCRLDGTYGYPLCSQSQMATNSSTAVGRIDLKSFARYIHDLINRIFGFIWSVLA